jgi:hypothetical protein
MKSLAQEIACEKIAGKTSIIATICDKVSAFKLISILSNEVIVPQFYMEHPDLCPYYVFNSNFHKGAQENDYKESSCFSILYSNFTYHCYR